MLFFFFACGYYFPRVSVHFSAIAPLSSVSHRGPNSVATIPHPRFFVHALPRLSHICVKHQDLAFPASLSTNERRYAHLMCQNAGLISRSRGKGDSRFLTVQKQKVSSSAAAHRLVIGDGIARIVAGILQASPVSTLDEEAIARAHEPSAHRWVVPVPRRYNILPGVLS